MAAATSDSAAGTTGNLHAESLPLIDLRFLSQAELFSLSLCSSASSSSSSSSLYLLQSDADVSTPKIDRSVFNESAGSRKQTFSRLRLTPRNHNNNNNNNNGRSSRFTSTALLQQQQEQPLDEEDSRIVSVLKSLFGSNLNSVQDDNDNDNDNDIENGSDSLVSIPVQQGEDLSYGRRKRGRPRTKEAFIHPDNDEKGGYEAVGNDNGTVGLQHLLALESLEEEVSRRSEGFHTEAEVLGFMEGLEGEWMSARKKRKIVEANLFGDALPPGWKLMLCIMKRASFAWLALRRYISPNGRQFLSCKEVSSHLLSFSGNEGVSRTDNRDIDDGIVKLTDKTTSANAADFTPRSDGNGDDFICRSTLSVTFNSIEHDEQATPLKLGSPAEIQAGKKYKCHKCTMSYEEQDGLLEHLLSSHRKLPKRLRRGASMHEEVIIKNGMYECQFCSKTFEDRHRFFGHQGNHIKDYVKRLAASDGVLTIQKEPLSAPVKLRLEGLRIQELIGVDQSHVSLTSNTGTHCEVISAVPSCETNAESAWLNEKNNTTCKSSDNEGILQTVVDSNVSQIVTCFMDQPNEETGCELRIFPANSKEEMSNNANIKDRLVSSAIKDAEVDDGHLVGKHRLLMAFDSSCTMQDVVFDHKEQRSSEGCSVVPSGNNQIYGSVNNVNELLTSMALETIQEIDSEGDLLVPFANEDKFLWKEYGVCNNTIGKLTGNRNSESRLDKPSCLGQAYGDPDNANNILFMTVEKQKNEVSRSTCNDGAHIAFGRHQTAQDADVVTSAEQDSCSKDCSSTHSWNQQAFANEDNKTGLYSCTIDELNQKSGSLVNSHCLSGNKLDFGGCSVENNLNQALACSVEEEPRYKDLENPSKKEFLNDFSCNKQFQVDAKSESIWRTDKGNDLGESELFFKKFDSIPGFESLRSGSVENMEYDFFTSQMSSHSDESKVSSYNGEMAEDLDTSVWLEKKALALWPKMTSQQLVSAMCVWCRNEFHYEALDTELQTGAMGIMCTVCKAKFSGQVNFQ